MALWYPDRPYRTPITSQNAKVLEAVTNGYLDLSEFPSAGLHAHAKNGGGDIRMTKADGITEVAREIVSCDTGAETGEIHFDTTGILTGSDVVWWLYYGDPAASDYAIAAIYGAENVWDSNYKIVCHFESDSFLDSTDVDNDLTNNGTTDTTGRMGDARDYDGSDWVEDTSVTGNNKQEETIELWFKPDNVTDITRDLFTMGHGAGTSGNYMNVFQDEDDIHYELFPGGSAVAVGVLTAGVLVRITIIHSVANSRMELYVDGVEEDTDTTYQDGSTNHSYLNLGRNTAGVRYINGVLDEFRYSAFARSANYDATVFNNQSDAANFWSIGAEETIPAQQVMAI